MWPKRVSATFSQVLAYAGTRIQKLVVAVKEQDAAVKKQLVNVQQKLVESKDWKMQLYERVIRPVAFCFDAERMHNSSIRALRWMGKSAFLRERFRRHYRFTDPRLRCQVCGLQLENPIGLAAGYDKNGVAALESLLEAVDEYQFVSGFIFNTPGGRRCDPRTVSRRLPTVDAFSNCR